MTPKAYRIFVGARNTQNHSILPGDDAIIRRTLGRYFNGWTIQKAEGIWEDVPEETRLIHVVAHKDNYTAVAGKKPFESCIAQLKNDMKQHAIMVEEGGTVSFL